MALLDVRLKEYNDRLKLHAKNEKTLKAIYYTLGFISTALGSILTVFASHDDTLSPTLFLSFAVLFINSLLNFGKIEQKISGHHDMKNQYQTLVMDIQDFLETNPDSDELLHFESMISEKQKLLLGYETTTFCFN